MTIHGNDRRPAKTDIQDINDCWNQIGVRGDSSCSSLSEYIDCHNCPVHAQAAAALLDRITIDEVTIQHSEHYAPAANALTGSLTDSLTPLNSDSLFLFKIADEWLALPTRLFEEVTPLRPLHSLPHRRNPLILGIVNMRGTLITCISLASLLGISHSAYPTIDATDTAKEKSKKHKNNIPLDEPRLLMIKHQRHTTVFPVDQVHGVLRVVHTALQAVPTNLANSTSGYTRNTFIWRDKCVGNLNQTLLFQALNQELT